jgi:hypothetical protein
LDLRGQTFDEFTLEIAFSQKRGKWPALPGQGHRSAVGGVGDGLQGQRRRGARLGAVVAVAEKDQMSTAMITLGRPHNARETVGRLEALAR